MLLRDIQKMNAVNDGTRSLYESIAIPEVLAALKDWKVALADRDSGVLIGGLAVSYYVRPRNTTDVDIMFLNAADIPDEVAGFKRTRPGAFQHNKTHVEIEVISPQSINIPAPLADKVSDTAVNLDGIRVASPSGLVALKLHRLKRYDKVDIASLVQHGQVDLSGWNLPQSQIDMVQGIVDEYAE